MISAPFARSSDAVFDPNSRRPSPPASSSAISRPLLTNPRTLSLSPVKGSVPLSIICDDDASLSPEPRRTSASVDNAAGIKRGGAGKPSRSSSSESLSSQGRKTKASRLSDEETKEPRQQPGQLRKTEICRMWKNDGVCSFGDQCMFAHGIEEIRSRQRPYNFRTKVCEDLARKDHVCSYMLNDENRCNFAHPGDALRIAMNGTYFDSDYAVLVKAHDDDYPKGIYL
eukprot:TRINITY_DN1946_c0_g1_i2.p1 TRINITY_DN1946_c0_g1~~TRINITY_DN1946_c0_g1_i2.p1  ORF type:complete len:227 (-),score=60.55 TRINITY_DN1946_c0_g1_i2:142-822(-)